MEINKLSFSHVSLSDPAFFIAIGNTCEHNETGQGVYIFQWVCSLSLSCIIFRKFDLEWRLWLSVQLLVLCTLLKSSIWIHKYFQVCTILLILKVITWKCSWFSKWPKKHIFEEVNKIQSSCKSNPVFYQLLFHAVVIIFQTYISKSGHNSLGYYISCQRKDMILEKG